ncbi:hypothetical protein K3495_g2709 [Podosphaera aphanis]|nr:hypothetical protein K3495_g2709 [Podosphaera aphanis]
MIECLTTNELPPGRSKLDESQRTDQSSWYYNIIQYLRHKTVPSSLDRTKTAAFLRSCAKYREGNSILYHLWKERWRRCVTQNEVASILHKAHDEFGHFASGITLRFLREVYWPRMLKDVTDYIGGYLTFAKQGTALKSKTLSKFLVASPNEVWGIDFMGPFPKAEKSNHQYILLLVDYFTRIFGTEDIPVGIYADEGPHFQKATREFCEEAGVVWIPAPVAAKRSVGMVEKANDLLQRVLIKGGDSSTWPLKLAKSTFDLNRREVAHLGFSTFELRRGYLTETTLSSSFPSQSWHSLATKLKEIEPGFFEGFTPP